MPISSISSRVATLTVISLSYAVVQLIAFSSPRLSVKTAVGTSKTLFEIQRELGIDQNHTREVLLELDLLELVYGRVSTMAAIETAEIDERIRTAVVGDRG